MNRDFTAPAPDRLWVADAARIRTGEGAFWLAAVRDAFSDPIVGRQTGDSHDNALVENSFSRLKIEPVHRRSWRTRDEAENELFACIDGFYNTERIQKDLGQLSPDEHEAARHTTQADLATTPASPTAAR
ncbi:IS3 family transposase [Saccharothrix lopnurensis]|uniref:IS3 family transposase n=1 Tax=Saccharothrix lopnurensis TaxID=1670621 RepID=A0ABW1PJ92_9PSEU